MENKGKSKIKIKDGKSIQDPEGQTISKSNKFSTTFYFSVKENAIFRVI